MIYRRGKLGYIIHAFSLFGRCECNLRNGKKVIFAGVIIVSLYLFGLLVSKIQLEQHLNKEYQSDYISLLIIYPINNILVWEFYIRTDKARTTGNSSVLGSDLNIESERIVGD